MLNPPNGPPLESTFTVNSLMLLQLLLLLPRQVTAILIIKPFPFNLICVIMNIPLFNHQINPIDSQLLHP